MLTKNEQHALRNAMKTGEPFCMMIRAGKCVVIIEVVKAPPVWAPAVGLARLRKAGAGYGESSQYFDRADYALNEIRRLLK